MTPLCGARTRLFQVALVMGRHLWLTWADQGRPGWLDKMGNDCRCLVMGSLSLDRWGCRRIHLAAVGLGASFVPEARCCSASCTLLSPAIPTRDRSALDSASGRTLFCFLCSRQQVPFIQPLHPVLSIALPLSQPIFTHNANVYANPSIKDVSIPLCNVIV